MDFSYLQIPPVRISIISGRSKTQKIQMFHGKTVGILGDFGGQDVPQKF